MNVRPTVAVVVAALALVACGGDDEPEPTPAAIEEPEAVAEPEAPEEVPPAGFAPLTGAPLDDAQLAELEERPALVVKVANAPAARPQAGLEEADVVIEETVEGGVTRFMAIFHSQLPDQVGPVRSGRLVDADLGSGYGTPVFAYSGARPEVQTRLRGASMVALEEGAPGFVRTSDRRRPDNLFVVPETTLEAGAAGARALEDAGLVFDDEPPAGEVTCPPEATDCDDPGAAISVAMSASFQTGWSFDEAEGVYRRQQNGADSTVTGAGRIGAANVIVLATRHYSPGCCDSAGSPYLESDVIGGDRGLVLRDGRRYEVRWDKPEASAPLRVLDPETGEPFPLAPGPSWILLPSTERYPG